jgi:2-phosphoglycerate kinase
MIFVGGIHGVGKTLFCRNVTQHLDIEHVTASSLIRETGRAQLRVSMWSARSTFAQYQKHLGGGEDKGAGEPALYKYKR